MRRETALFALCGLLNLAFLRAEVPTDGKPQTPPTDGFGDSCAPNSCIPGLSCTNGICLCRDTGNNVTTKCANKFITWRLISEENVLHVQWWIKSTNMSVILAIISGITANSSKRIAHGIRFNGLQPGTRYNVTLSFNNTLSKNNPSFDLAAYAYTLPAKPENITEADYSNGTLEVTWDQNGDVNRTECRLLGSDEKPIVSDYRCSWTFGPKDIVRVHGVNVTVFNGWENKSGDSYQFNTPYEYVPVTNLTATAKGRRVWVDWDSPQAPADVNYTVYIEDRVHVTPENNCSFKDERKIVLCRFGNGTHGNCSGDAPNGFWEYDVTVEANTNKVTSNVTTGITAPGKVSTLNVKTWSETDTCGVEQRTNRSFVCVTWKELCPRDRNSFIGHYRLVLNGDSEDQDQTLKKESSLHRYNDSTAQEYRRDAHLTEYNVWLYAKPNHTFQLTIKPVTIHGTEGPESTMNFSTPDVPKPVVPNITEIEQNVPKDKINSTQTTIQFVVKSSKFLFEDKDGNPVDTVVLLTSGGTKPKVYDKSEDYDKYPGWENRTEALENGGYRISEDALNRLGSGPLTVTIGDEANCTSSQDKYCDGALEAGKTYSVWVSLCNEAHCVRVLLVANQTTAATPTLEEVLAPWKLAGILLGVFGGAILIGVLLCCTTFRDKMQVSSKTQDLSEWGNEMDNLKRRPLKRPMKLTTLESVISKKQRDDFMLLRDEFEDLCLITRTKRIPNTASLMDINLSKNRYADILAYDHSRVKLTTDDEGSDYINANFVPGYNREDEYVACQGPLPYTVGDFWRMVWEHRMPIIVMLTQPKENGKIKCEQYWPAERGEEVEYDNMKVTNISVSNVNDYNITIFSISNMQEESQPFEVVHFHHLEWPDMTADISPESMIEFLTVVRQHVRPDKPGPMVVHCSAGVGRTGTFISIDYAMQFISQRPIRDELDIFGFILRMRQSRGKMIQTEDQYLFIHQCARFLMAERRRRESEGTGNGKRCLPHASSTTSIDSARGDSRCSLQNGDLEELALEPADMDTVELDTNEDLPRSDAEAGDVEMSVYDMTACDDGPISASSTENLCVP